MSILVVDDDPGMTEFCRLALADAGYDSLVAHSAGEALSTIRRNDIEIVLSDVRMPGTSGLELLRAISSARRDTDIVLMTGHASIAAAVEAIRMGALDYIEKPFPPRRLQSLIARLLDKREQRSRLRQEGPESPFAEDRTGLVGDSAVMKEVMETVRRAAARHHPVLITGETGTGKELIARAIHHLSRRSTGPFVAVDCGALSPGTIESELFGHVKGAYTGTVGDRTGLLRSSARGTLFLDEVGELPVSSQVKLLRVLQEQEFRPVGADRILPFEGRVIAASNMDFEKAIAGDRFRADLYFRLNVYGIAVPPLRARRSDIPLLIQHMLAKHGEGRVSTATSEVVQVLSSRDWPGNVRELENCLVRMIANCDGAALEVKHLPREWRNAISNREMAGTSLREAERLVILNELDRAGGNVALAAQRMDMSRATLYRKLLSHGIRPGERGRPGSRAQHPTVQ